jgi:hypothetical protein
LVLDEAIATPISGHFIQNYSELEYFCSLVATSPADCIENSKSILCFVEYLNRSEDFFVVILVLDEEIATPRSGHLTQNYSKLDYFYSLVPRTPTNHIENPASSLCFVEYSNRSLEALSSFWFWMKQSQRQGAPIYASYSPAIVWQNRPDI